MTKPEATRSKTAEPLLLVDVQDALSNDEVDQPPSASLLSDWANKAHSEIDTETCEVTVRLVDEVEMTELNQVYRGKIGSTNVLSFPVENDFDLISSDDGGLPRLLGDIVICHSVVENEASEQNKSPQAHYAHMVTHGILHLHGYDHLDDSSAEQMEALEAKILSYSGFENPYT